MHDTDIIYSFMRASTRGIHRARLPGGAHFTSPMLRARLRALLPTAPTLCAPAALAPVTAAHSFCRRTAHATFPAASQGSLADKRQDTVAWGQPH